MRGRATSILMALVLPLAACTASESPEGAEGSLVQRPTPSDTSPTSPSASLPQTTASTPPPEPEYVEPLVLAYDVHRQPLRLPERTARRLVSGEVTRWPQLGRRGGVVDIRRGPRAVQRAATRPDVIAVVPASRVTPVVQVATVAGVDPLVSPRAYPLTTQAAARQPDVTRVVVAGDIMLGRRVATEAPGGARTTLRPLAPLLAKADLTVGNLESTLSDDGRPRQGDDSFAADPAVLAALDQAGFDLLSLANNHTGDYGPRALRQTLRLIDRSPIDRVGAGRDASEAWAPVVLRAGGARVGFLAFNAIGETPRATRNRPGAAEVRMQPRTGPLQRSDLRRMTRAVSRLTARADVVIVLPHWGDQYTNVPHPDQRVVGAALVEAGADVVVGGHPHWVQGIQLHRGRPVVHSLGNFVFDMDFSVPTREGALLELVFWDGDLRRARLQPYLIGPDFAPRLVRGDRAQVILARVWEASDRPFRR